MRFYVIFALFIVMASAAPRPKPRAACVAPKLWEATTLVYDHHARYYSRGRMAYDAAGKRIRYVEDVEVNATRASYDNLYLFEKRMHYQVDQKTKKCSKEEIKEEFQPIEIYPNSTFLGDAILGTLDAPGSGVIVQTWSHKSTDGSYYLEVFTQQCLPVEFEHIGKDAAGNYFHHHFQYFDIKPGISNKEVFDVPKECA